MGLFPIINPYPEDGGALVAQARHAKKRLEYASPDRDVSRPSTKSPES